MDIKCVQQYMRKEYYKADSERGLFQTFAWFVEEVGELGEALLKRDKSGIAEEIADVIAWAISIANLLDIDVCDALRSKYEGLSSSCYASAH